MADVTPRVLVMNRAGQSLVREIANALGCNLEGRGDRTDADHYFDNALDQVRDHFAAGHPIVAVCAAGILIRAVAPLLNDKRVEPPVIAVADDRTVVPLLGGHRGANRLARKVAAAIGGRSVITTAGDGALGFALDEPPQGWRLSNIHKAKDVMATILAGGGARLVGDAVDAADWLSDVPEGTDLSISASVAPVDGADLSFHPLRVTIGVGCARNCPADEVESLVRLALNDADIAPGAIASLNTIGLKADEPAILALADRLQIPLRFFEATELEEETPRLVHPSTVVFDEVGCHGVSEAAALRAAGSEAVLVSPKTKSANATCAIAVAATPISELRGRKRGRVSLVGIGPGQSAWRTPEASRMVANADELVGYGFYIDLLGSLAHGKPRQDFPLGGEEARCRYALERAAEGVDVALICSGDAGIYAMGALVFELLSRGDDNAGVSDAARRVEVVTAPGISALQAAAARSGAPLGHDFCAISLSDLLTPVQNIQKRITAAAQGDFVIAFYNPVSKKRRTLLAEAREVLLKHRPQDTPVLLARSLGRPDETLTYVPLSGLDVEDVDMMTVVLVGSSQSQLLVRGDGPAMFTPRGYARRIDGDLSEAKG